MADDRHRAAQVADEEAAHTPLLVAERMDDLGAGRAYRLVDGVDVPTSTLRSGFTGAEASLVMT
ncbi:hypothetical protein [Actinomadura livida]|uniref:Uncharacterized protein n=1 Tax=Actinomadura livida TaxID=79909 RepID=A0A7W7I789_9ACTN|nr:MULTISPECIES: hypothetical protein [Actinomadura]MBB4771822.1 hypothetical protein [Actinomadura catellatispora]